MGENEVTWVREWARMNFLGFGSVRELIFMGSGVGENEFSWVREWARMNFLGFGSGRE